MASNSQFNFNFLNPWFNVCMGPMEYPISYVTSTFVWTTIEFSLEHKKTRVSNQLLSWLDSDFPLLYRTALGLFFVLWWNPLFRFVIVTMTNQMRIRVEWNTKKTKSKGERKQQRKNENQKKKLSVEWKLGCWVMAS